MTSDVLESARKSADAVVDFPSFPRTQQSAERHGHDIGPVGAGVFRTFCAFPPVPVQAPRQPRAAPGARGGARKMSGYYEDLYPERDVGPGGATLRD